MKIIHCADLHLGSKMRAKLPEEKAEERRGEVREAFEKMLRYAKENGAEAVLISGDAFDSDRPAMRDKQLFYRAVEAHKELTFFYLRGNHDAKEENSLTEDLPNLFTFGNEWTTYSFCGVNITGAEWHAENAEKLYASLSLPENGVNIVLLHGDIGGEIDLRRLKEKNIDYLALGHIHSFSEGKIDERGTYAYSGCLEGRGYDECGKKGFVLLNVIPQDPGGMGAKNVAGGEKKISVAFVPSSIREITEYRVDVSAAKNDYEAREIVRRAVVSPQKDMVRVYLTGEVGFDRRALEKSVSESLSGRYYYASVKDETRAKCDFAAYAAENNSLKGEFVRLTLAREDLTAEEKDAVIRLGINVLENGEAEL